MKLIVGLGNPGKDYENTRHNIGFNILDNYLKYKNINPDWLKKFDGLYTKEIIDNNSVLFLKPQTYMNLSGESVRQIIDYYKINLEDVLIISDDLDLNVGNFKLKKSGSCGGHNGLRDIENKLKTSNYKRLKIGISNNKNIDTKNYVLGKFTKEDSVIINNLFNTIFNVLDDFFNLSFDDLMNKYNHKNK